MKSLSYSIRTLRKNLWSVLLVAYGSTGPVVAQSVSVSDNGPSFGPNIGNPLAEEFQFVETAARALPSGGTVLVQGGSFNRYPEPLILDTPVTIARDPNSVVSDPVRLGDRSGIVATETLNVMAYNVRLFDPLSPITPYTSLIWEDYARAVKVGTYLNAFPAHELDVVGLCEVWDFAGADGNFDLVKAGASTYPHFSYFDNPTSIKQNSGLALFSRLPLQAPSNLAFCDALPAGTVCATGNDIFANKGFMMATVQKGPFNVRIIHTHTQSSNSGNDMAARASQLIALNSQANAWLDANPDDVVIIMGDLNFPAEMAGVAGVDPQYNTAANIFEIEGRDVIRHTPRAEFLTDSRYLGAGQSVKTTALVHQDSKAAYTYQPDPVTFANGQSMVGNAIAKAFDGTSPNQRLDYMVYYPNGKTRIVPKKVQVIRPLTDVITAPIIGGGSTTIISSNDLSDHYAIRVEFELQRFQ